MFMKLAIPVNEDQQTICISYGRTPFFAIRDTEQGVTQYIDNSAAASQGGAGILASQALLDHGVQAVLTPHCGENAAKVLREADVSIYRTKGDSVEENVAAFLDGSLSPLTDIHPGYHGNVGG